MLINRLIKIFTIPAIKAVLLVLAAVVYPLTAATAAELDGYVLDANDIGVASVELLLEIDGQQLVRYTGPAGEFKFYDLPETDDYTLTTAKTGYTVDTITGQVADNSDLTLYIESEPVAVYGVVISSDGYPLSDVEIDGGALGTVLSDIDGEFSFTVPFGSNYSLKIIEEEDSDLMFLNNTIDGTASGDIVRVVVGELN